MIATERENLKEVLSAKAFKRYKDVDSFSKIKLKQKPLKINSVTARQYKSDGSKITVIYIADQDRDLANRRIKPVVLVTQMKLLTIITKDVDTIF